MPAQLGFSRSGYAPELVGYQNKLYSLLDVPTDNGNTEKMISLLSPDSSESGGGLMPGAIRRGDYVYTPLSGLEGVERNVAPTVANFEKYGVQMNLPDANKVRYQDAINYAGRISNDTLSKMATEGMGLSAEDAAKFVSAIDANRSALQADNAGVVDAWNNLGVGDLDKLRKAMFKPTVLGDNYGNEAYQDQNIVAGARPLDYQIHFGVNPEDADGIRQKYMGGYFDYSKLKYDPNNGLYSDDYKNQLPTRETKGQGSLLIPLVISMMAGGAGSPALSAFAGAAQAGVTGGNPLTGAITAGVGSLANAGIANLSGSETLGRIGGNLASTATRSLLTPDQQQVQTNPLRPGRA